MLLCLPCSSAATVFTDSVIYIYCDIRLLFVDLLYLFFVLYWMASTAITSLTAYFPPK
jgi:hypothetical protein